MIKSVFALLLLALVAVTDARPLVRNIRSAHGECCLILSSVKEVNKMT